MSSIYVNDVDYDGVVMNVRLCTKCVEIVRAYSTTPYIGEPAQACDACTARTRAMVAEGLRAHAREPK